MQNGGAASPVPGGLSARCMRPARASADKSSQPPRSAQHHRRRRRAARPSAPAARRGCERSLAPRRRAPPLAASIDSPRRGPYIRRRMSLADELQRIADEAARTRSRLEELSRACAELRKQLVAERRRDERRRHRHSGSNPFPSTARGRVQMKFFIDTGDVGEIREAHAHGSRRRRHHQPVADRQDRPQVQATSWSRSARSSTARSAPRCCRRPTTR